MNATVQRNRTLPGFGCGPRPDGSGADSCFSTHSLLAGFFLDQIIVSDMGYLFSTLSRGLDVCSFNVLCEPDNIPLGRRQDTHDNLYTSLSEMVRANAPAHALHENAEHARIAVDNPLLRHCAAHTPHLPNLLFSPRGSRASLELPPPRRHHAPSFAAA